MPLWKNTDDANSAVLWAPSQVNKAPNTVNRNALYGNTTANAYFAGVTVGMFGVDEQEVAYNPGIPHTGWVLRTVGQGGRSGRTHYEVLVAGSMTTENSGDDSVLGPVANTGNTANN